MRTLLAAVLSVFVLVAAADPVFGAGVVTVDGLETGQYPVVEAQISATGSASGPLRPEDVRVSVAGQSADVTAITPVSSAGLEVLLVIDVSGSMAGAAIASTKEAAESFLAQLPAEVRVGLVSFGSQPTLISRPITARGPLTQGIGSLTARGETALYDGIVFAAQQFSPDATSRVMVVLSDGGDTVSSAPFSDALNAAGTAQVNVIELTTRETNTSVLQALADAGGGSVNSLSEPAALPAVYRSVAASLVNRYRVSFVAPNGVGGAVEITITRGPLTFSDTVPFTPPAVASPVQTTDETKRPAPVADVAVPPSEPLWMLLVGSVAIFAAIVVLALAMRARRMPTLRQQLGFEEGARESATAAVFGRIRSTAGGVVEWIEARRDQREKERSGPPLAVQLQRAGVTKEPGEFIAVVASVAVTAGVVLAIVAGPWGILLGLVATPIGARAWLTGRIADRKDRFVEALPDLLQVLTATLRTGYGFLQALEAAAVETAEPVRSELRRVLFETRAGRDPIDGLHALSDRVDSDDLRWVVSAIDINRQVGGDLARVLETVAHTIRDRQRLRRQVQALTAEGRLSAYIMLALPPGVGLLSALANPDYFSKVTHGPGVLLLVGAAVSMLVGWAWMRRMIKGVV